MMIKTKTACWLISLSIKILPREYQNKRMIVNLIETSHIDVREL
mgnify:CR=1 FL=1